MDNQQQRQIKIQSDLAAQRGQYSNLLSVGHTKEEFVLDFFNIFQANGVHTSRVITSPGHMKRIVKALQGQIEKYEKQFGDIETADEPKRPIGFQAD